MRKSLPFLIMLLMLILSSSLSAQVLVSGKIIDHKQKPVAGASITLKDTYDGATSDSLGQFSFKTFEKGNFVLIVSSIGYVPVEQNITLGTTAVNANIELKEEISELKAVVLSAGTFEAGDKKKATVLNPIDIVTTASANADVTAAIKTLPGAQQVGESEGLFVRGGTAAETKTFIDGTLVNNFFYSSVPNISQRGRFSPFIFKGTVFSAGGYSALYGQALSSALILESIDLPERSSASLGFSALGLSGGYQQLSKNKKSSWGTSYGYTNLYLAFKAIKQKQDFFTVPEYHTGDANFRIKTSQNGMLKYYGYFSANRLGFTNQSLDSIGYKDAFRLRNFNMYHNFGYKQNLANKWAMNAGFSYTNNKDVIAGNMQDQKDQQVALQALEFKNFNLDAKGNYFNAKTVFEKRFHGLNALRFGSEYNYSDDHSVYTTYNNQQYTDNLQEHIKSLFAETDIYITNNVAAKFGSRLEHSALLNKFNIAPRVSVAYKVGKESQASLAYGIFYQNPERKYLPSASSLTFSKATHYIAQYQKTTNLVTFRAEAFYKKYDDLVKTSMVNSREQAVSNNGSGDAKGFEIFWRDKKSIRNFDYWLSYSYLDTKRDFLNFPNQMEPSFASRHTASLVLKKFVAGLKTQFNASYTYASGRPYYNIRFDANNNKYKITDQGKTIDYNSMSFSVNYLPNINKQGANKFTVIVFSVTNVLNTKQVYGYQYSYNGLRKEAIVPPSRMFVFLGAFISFGVDRSQDVINSNL